MTIRSGLSDTQLSRTASDVSDHSDEEGFTYPASESEEEEFLYPETTKETPAATSTAGGESPPSEEVLTSIAEPEQGQILVPDPTVPVDEPTSPVSPPAVQTQPHPSPAQLEALSAAASSGDLSLLKKLFQTALQSGELEAFALANDASSRTGFTVLHAAASRGYLDIVKWLVEDCGAIPDLEDREGEGYLDIVRWLCERGGISSVDVRSKGGWTPLINAASKGHLPVVLYLLTKQGANPLVRNNWGETAYDAAAAVFEVWICEVLQKAEAERWRGTTAPYNSLAVHTTVPLILYENQRLDGRLKTLAVSGGKPKFSASGLGRPGRRAPFELKLPSLDEGTGTKAVAAWRSGVQLPLTEDPWTLPETSSKDRPSLEGSERSHFWLSDWTLDVTHPGVDAEAGWQYAQDFSSPDETWTAEPPPQLQRLLSGSGLMTTGLGSPSSSHSRASSSSSATSVPATARAPTWVRRRRWVRVMRRRLDIPPLPFQEPDGAMYHLALDGSFIPFIGDDQSDFGEDEGQELGTMTSTRLSSAQDYVSRARYLVGIQRDAFAIGETLSAVEARRAIAKLERATTELRQGILSDDDTERKTQAEVLLNAYSRELERRRLAAGAQGLLISGADDDFVEDDDDDEEEFRYPGYTPPGTSVRSASTEYLSRSFVSRAPTDLTPHLSQAPEFRVPTHEAPQKVLTPRWTPPTPHQVHAQWERDDTVSNCNDCRRRFGFLLRRVSPTTSTLLDPSDIVRDPVFPETAGSTSSHRVCQGCYDEVNASIPTRFSGSTSSALERIVIDQRRLMAPGQLHRQESSSQLSDLAECPVCSTSLADLGLPGEQEAHVKNCLEGDAGTTPQAAKYLVYKLPGESALLGVECVICLEEFTKGALVARLSCFCSFHNGS
ncbi:uncharacterized protein EDB91DRAFT_1043176 [Suillus paluster]|uniref:uncharacterized protein n=1 Tax=Suillus paluster TaxID=48578 RepID=UPI001B8818A9|nr:uncharacterized protein EDB91DRAFT_1043176 [Suillus paluster]KAG1753914.1 hypothetical protein EDB91DRAFT_1043176 [Suillus paluster]